MAIFRREFYRYFHRKSTGAALCVSLFLAGVLTLIYHVLLGYSTVNYPLSWLMLSWIVLFPLLTCRQSAGERAERNEEWLRSLPLSRVSGVLGGYFAALVFFLLTSAPFALIPLLVKGLGGGDALLSYGAVAGYLLVGASLLSLCTLCSACAPSPRAAGLMSGGILAVLFALSYFALSLPTAGWFSLFALVVLSLGCGAAVVAVSRSLRAGMGVGLCLVGVVSGVYGFTSASFEGLISHLVLRYDLFAVFGGFLYGRLNLGGILFCLGTTALFLFLACLASERRFRPRTEPKFAPVRRAALACGLALLAVLLPFFASLLPASVADAQVSGDADVFRVGSETKAMLDDLDTDVTIWLLSRGGEGSADRDLCALADGYARASRHVKFRILDTRTGGEFLASHGLSADSFSDQSFLVESGMRSRFLDNTALYYYYNTVLGYTMTPAVYEFYLTYSGSDANAVSLREALLENADATVAFFDGEFYLTNTVAYVTAKAVPVIGFLQNGSTQVPDDDLLTLCSWSGYDLLPLDSLASIPTNCALLLIHAPVEDLTASDAAALKDYLTRGGKLFLTTFYQCTDLPNLNAVLAEYGLAPDEPFAYLTEGDSAYLPYPTEPQCMVAKVASSAPATGDYVGSDFLMIYAHAIFTTEVEGVAVTPWIYTTDRAVRVTLGDDGELIPDETPAVYVDGVIAEAKGGGTVVWLSTPYALDTTVNSGSGNSNYSLFFSAVKWLTGTRLDSVEIASHELPITGVVGSPTVFWLWLFFFVLLLPLASLLRRRRG